MDKPTLALFEVEGGRRRAAVGGRNPVKAPRPTARSARAGSGDQPAAPARASVGEAGCRTPKDSRPWSKQPRLIRPLPACRPKRGPGTRSVRRKRGRPGGRTLRRSRARSTALATSPAPLVACSRAHRAYGGRAGNYQRREGFPALVGPASVDHELPRHFCPRVQAEVTGALASVLRPKKELSPRGRWAGTEPVWPDQGAAAELARRVRAADVRKSRS